MVNPETTAFIVADAWYALIAALGGLLTGVAGYLLAVRRRGVPAALGLILEPDGKPHIPGGLDVWKGIFIRNPKNRYDQKLSKAANSWKEGDEVIEALFALCRKPVDNEPLKMFMTLTDIDRNRATLEDLTAQSGGGRLSLKGFVTYGPGGPLSGFVYRLQGAATNVCGGEPDIHQLDRMAIYQRCKAESVDRAVRAVDAPLVTAMAGQTGATIVLAGR